MLLVVSFGWDPGKKNGNRIIKIDLRDPFVGATTHRSSTKQNTIMSLRLTGRRGGLLKVPRVGFSGIQGLGSRLQPNRWTLLDLFQALYSENVIICWVFFCCL